MSTNGTPKPNRHGHVEGGPCVNRRFSCVGRLQVEAHASRTLDGKISKRDVLVCSHCQQGHGLVGK